MADQPTYAQSFSNAKGHGKAFLQSTIGAHPVAAGVTLAILIVLIIVLGFYVAHYKSKCKSGFHISKYGNLDTGNNNPLWHMGSMDAGNYGPVHRDATAWNVAAYHPGWRMGRAGANRRMRHGWRGRHREGLATSQGSCGPGETAVTYKYPPRSVATGAFDAQGMPVYQTIAGGSATECVASGPQPELDLGEDMPIGPITGGNCGVGWDPAATAEAQALATVGSLQHDSYGEYDLQSAIDAAYDTNTGLTDAQLQSVMHHGGSP